MSDAPLPGDDPSLSPPPRVVREVDWLGVAPWLLLLRAPAVALGALPLAALVALLIGGVGDGMLLAKLRRVLSDPVLFNAWIDSFGWIDLLRYAVWGWFGLAAAENAARELTHAKPIGWARLVRRATARIPQLAGSLGLVAAAVSAPAMALLVVGIGSRVSVIATVAGVFWPVLVLLFGLPLALLVLGAFFGWPLLWGAIAVDATDPFDAVSRLYAYTWQRLGRMVCYVVIAAAIGLAAGAVLETIAWIAIEATHRLAAPETPTDALHWWIGALARAARGFYPAYLFTAGTALYLLLRHDVDGQPIDEIAAD